MRYMIAHMIEGEAKDYHINLSRALASAYRLRPTMASIDPHLTVKAPFDALSTDLYDVERLVDRYVRTKSPLTFTLKGFGSFDGRVVYMTVDAPEETHAFIKGIKEELREIPWLEFKPHEEVTTLHATLAYPKTTEQAEDMVAKLSERGGREFTCTMSGVALLRKGEHRWEIFKEYTFGGDGGFGPGLTGTEDIVV